MSSCKLICVLFLLVVFGLCVCLLLLLLLLLLDTARQAVRARSNMTFLGKQPPMLQAVRGPAYASGCVFVISPGPVCT